jgi:exodeoxyribonuclease VII large subunit
MAPEETDVEELTLPWPEEEEEVPEEPAEEPAETVLTVSEVNRMAKHALERLTVTVQGEISGLNTRYPYYVYFDLRDSGASLPAILQKRAFDSLGFPLEDGASIIVRGTLSLFEKQGKYQIRVAEIRPFGEGEIQRRIEALKRKLHAEGLFDEALKKPLPAFPERIGVVTSTRGAAIRDVTVTLGRRFPAASVFVRGVRVQGEGAVEQICAGLRFFDEAFPVDLVILARGGGSIQDLEPFSTEPVARAIAGLRVPVVTGIGHEPDVSIADLVADRRASTPTAAAEAAVPDRLDIQALLAKSAAGLRRHAAAELQHAQRHLEGILRLPLYRGPDFVLGAFLQRFEKTAVALPESPSRGLTRSRHRLAVVACRPVFRLTAELLARRLAGIEAARARLSRCGPAAVQRDRGALERIKARADALSPLAVLERGYSITFRKDTGAVVRSPDEVEVGSPLEVRLARGALEAEVTGKE